MYFACTYRQKQWELDEDKNLALIVFSINGGTEAEGGFVAVEWTEGRSESANKSAFLLESWKKNAVA